MYVPFVFIFVFLFAVVIGILVLQEFNTAVQSEFDTEAKEVVSDGLNAMGIFDYGSIILVGGIFMGLIISGFYIRSNPIFFFTFLVAFVVVMLVMPAMSNAFYAFKNDATISSELNVTSQLPIIDYVTDNFPFFAALGGSLFLIALFAKPFIFGGVRE